MNIYQHPICDLSIGAPSDTQDGSCSALPVHVHTDIYGMWCNSFWKPDEAELAALNAGGSVRLQIRCSNKNHPVVAVGACFKPEGE